MKRFPVDPEAWRFCLPVLGLMILATALHWFCTAALLALLLLALLAFFRDPRRSVPRAEGIVVSPADGVVDTLFTNTDPEAGPENGQVIGIFLSVLNVHVNRAPVASIVEGIRYVPGKFLDARDPECQRCNEANWIFLRAGAHRLTVRQVAGLIARRIVCRVDVGQHLRRGERIGMIRFGSRTEVYLPPGALTAVRIGDKVTGGVTVLASLPDPAPMA